MPSDRWPTVRYYREVVRGDLKLMSEVVTTTNINENELNVLSPRKVRVSL